MLVVLAAVYGLEIHQMDVKTTFFNGNLEEEIYIEQPEGFVIPGKEKKDLGVADLFLEIKIHKTSQGLALSQSHYIKIVLEKFKHLGFKVAKTSVDVNLALAKNKGQSISQLDYARVFGCLIYIMNCTLLDIACAISKLSRYTSNPGQSHWMSMKRVLGYLEYTHGFALHYSKYHAMIEGYCDANWITDLADSESTSGYVFTIGGGSVSWKSSKQTCIACSTMEVEFIDLNKAGEEVEWLRNFLEDIPFWPKLLASICI
ncbi:secreted RxLR effector protein 161-like [Nicotiana sylvestris]|uniref:secreted RxLR effector protein 161-like n=1 Tax=Nicotiana sylvestris TaxID=4096 RepID=UPI00388C7A1C